MRGCQRGCRIDIKTDVPVVRKQVVVNAPVEQAFAVFTDRFGDFKPPEHNLLATPIAETMFEPRAGEHIYDRAVDGSECRWARILAYEPPARGSARVLGVGLEAVLATLGSSPDMLRLAAKERLRQAG